MNLPPLVWIGLCLFLILIFTFWGSKDPKRALRSIPAFRHLKRTIDLSVEDGSRLHIGLGRGGILGPEAATAFAGLTLLRQVADIAADSDQPPIATTGDGGIMLLAQDTLRNTHNRLGIADQYHLRLAQTSGLTPFSYAAGAIPRTLDREVSASVLAGSFGEEIGLLTTATQMSSGFSVGGSENLTGQAILFASANQSLIGEEVFAAGAYLNAGPTHQASLRAQDILRWVVIFLLIGSSIIPLFGSVP
jgi:hypothetical protein